MKDKMKNNYKLIIGIIIGILISATGVYAVDTIIIDSKNVSYDNTNSKGSYKDVKDSIDELYKRTGVLSTKWVDPTLKGADPVLTNELIPIDLKSDGTVYYASLYTEWYNYKEKRWANAVKLVSSAKGKYTTGDKIPESDIESYFVWIPRYKYKLWNANQEDKYIDLTKTGLAAADVYKFNSQVRIIDVVFESKSTGKSNGSTNGTYLTHPAFTLNGKELNGIWVGKFETGYNQSGVNGNSINTTSWSKTGAEKNEQASNRIIVKPNVSSWRSISIKNMFLSEYNYNRALESHLMKNTEWGAVAYLSHSAYGIGTQVRINNNSDYKTGYSAAANTDQSANKGEAGTGDNVTKAYNTETGYLASTTGNIYGVYDMAGCAHEMTAAYVSGQPGESGFTTNELTQYKAYFDVYDANSSITLYSKMKLGDATGEMGPFYLYGDSAYDAMYRNGWYGNQGVFVLPSRPWFARGGTGKVGVTAGQFYFAWNSGYIIDELGFRLVLSPII